VALAVGVVPELGAAACTTLPAIRKIAAPRDSDFRKVTFLMHSSDCPPALGSKKRETDVDDVGVHAGIVATCIGVGQVVKLVAKRQRPFWGEEELHA
jgi:hypothetical protein